MARKRVIQVRCSDAEFELVSAMAGRCNRAVSDFVRLVLTGAPLGSVEGSFSQKSVADGLADLQAHYNSVNDPVPIGKNVVAVSGQLQVVDESMPFVIQAGTGEKVPASKVESKVKKKFAEFPAGHPPKCSCPACNKARGWRG